MPVTFNTKKITVCHHFDHDISEKIEYKKALKILFGYLSELVKFLQPPILKFCVGIDHRRHRNLIHSVLSIWQCISTFPQNN